MNIKKYVEELEQLVTRRQEFQQEAVEVFNNRILSMMRDYKITFGEALLWDYEGFENNVSVQLQENTLQQDFDFYLWENNVFDTPAGYLAADIFFGRQEDLVVRPYSGTINTHTQ